jgi:hypothetical protein
MPLINLDKSGRIGLRRLDQKPIVLSGWRQSEPRASILVTAAGDGKLWGVEPLFFYSSRV